MPKVSSLINPNRTYPHVGLLDQASPKTRREIGKKIARHRLWQSDDNLQDRAEDGSRVVYRSHSALDDFSGGSPYRQVAFLDEHSAVVALDESLRVDIVRLPRYCPPGNDGAPRRPRPLGKALAKQVEVTGASCSQALHTKIHSLRGGKGFALGLVNGAFRVYDAEYGSSTSMVHGTSFAPLKRRYHRDYQHNLSLTNILSQFGGHSLRFKLLEVDDEPSSIRSHPDTTPYRSLFSESMWDFRETGSGLMAAHVDNEMDCFSLRLLDSRLSTPALTSTALCVDGDSKELSGDVNEDIASVCFVSDYSLATSHNWGSRQIGSSPHRQSEVKIWDIRRLAQSSAEPAVGSILPSFPGIETHGMRANDVFQASSKCENDVCYLLGSNKETGTVVARFRPHSYRVDQNTPDEYMVLDPARRTIAGRCVVPGSLQINQVAVAPSLEFVALHTNAKTIDFFDLNTRPESFFNLDQEIADRRGKKRTHDDRPSREASSNEPPGLLASFPAGITDQHGIGSGVTCMAFNESATALILGSTDGDLFLFRGV